MRKFLSLILALAVAITVISSVAVFADETKVFDFGTPVKVDDSTYTIPVLVNLVGLNPWEGVDYFDNITVVLEPKNCTLSNGTLSSDASANSLSFAANQGATGNYALNSGGSSFSIDKNGYVLFTVNVTKVADDAVLSFKTTTEVADNESGFGLKANAANSATIELWKNVAPETNTTIEANGKTYTDVVNFTSSAKAVNGASKLSFDLYEGDAKHGDTYSVNLADWGLTIESGTINFNVAIIGAPATGVTLRNPVVQ